MKKMMVLALLAAMSLVLGQNASAQLRQPHYRTVQYNQPAMVCYVNGVNYPVDYNYQIWGTNGVGWFVIGRIVVTPNGYVAVRNDGFQFPAACQ